jgi:hypothetical protein
VKGVAGDEVPIVSCRFTIWAQTGRPRDTTPAGVATWLNRLPAASEKASDECFSWVLAHAWSRFRRAEKGAPFDAEEKDVAQDKETANTARGYDPVLWTVERLGPAVKPVTAQELLLRVRLRLRPRATLLRWLAELESEVATKSSKEIGERLAEARHLVEQIDAEPAAARRCFELLKRLHGNSQR